MTKQQPNIETIEHDIECTACGWYGLRSDCKCRFPLAATWECPNCGQYISIDLEELKAEMVAYMNSPEGQQALRDIEKSSKELHDRFRRTKRVDTMILSQPMTI